jgi:hypothetical protein
MEMLKDILPKILYLVSLIARLTFLIGMAILIMNYDTLIVSLHIPQSPGNWVIEALKSSFVGVIFNKLNATLHLLKIGIYLIPTTIVIYSLFLNKAQITARHPIWVISTMISAPGIFFLNKILKFDGVKEDYFKTGMWGSRKENSIR